MTVVQTNSADEFNLDIILKELGEFGRFQKINYILICFPVFLFGSYMLNYAFAAAILDYRCKIPLCDDREVAANPTTWLSHAIPFQNDAPVKCDYYKPIYNASISDWDYCGKDAFDTSVTIKCNEYVYESNEITIGNEFNINCIENEWMLTLIGTINNFGQFISLPISGYLSDRFGRRTLLIFGSVGGGLFGIAKSFSSSYPMYAVFEVLGAAAGAGTYSAAFILGMELVGPKYRVLGGVIIACWFTIGQTMLAVYAMYAPNFRHLLLILYSPTLLMISYFWLTPESVRWLLVKGRKDDAAQVLIKAASINNVTLSDHSLQELQNGRDEEKMEKELLASSNSMLTKRTNQEIFPILTIFKSRKLVLRLLNSWFCWLTIVFIYYGLSLNSVALDGNKYLNFIWVSLVEIPGNIISCFIMDRFGRRWSMSVSLLISGIACLGSQFVPSTLHILELILFLIGKCAIAVSFTALYVYTTEMYPTNLRHSVMSTCSMIGRVGSMVAPQTPLLAYYFAPLPLMIFAGMAIISGLLSLMFPETLNTSLPDTVDEAEHIGDKLINNERI